MRPRSASKWWLRPAAITCRSRRAAAPADIDQAAQPPSLRPSPWSTTCRKRVTLKPAEKGRPSGGLFLCALFGGFLHRLLGGLLLGGLLAGEILADLFRRVPDGAHRGLQLRRRDLEFFRAVADFIGLAQRDQGAVGGLVLLQRDVGLDLLCGVADLADRGFQLGRRDLELL